MADLTKRAAPLVSVVIASRDRPAKLAETLAGVARQDLGAFEVLVVDDGSSPPLAPPPMDVPLRLLRVEARGRSAARNAGARAAEGEVLVFLDDDIAVEPGFLRAHLEAHRRWPGALVTGAIVLPPEVRATPFGRFRHRLEQEGVPAAAGPTPRENFCAAGNMSIARAAFLALGGFDAEMASAEDQDLALRHRGRGGAIAYEPAASGVHRDSAVTLETYCARAESGMRALGAFRRRHPRWRENEDRERVNGPIRWGSDAPADVLKKAAKRVLATRPLSRVLLWGTRAVEARAPEARVLSRLYAATLGVFLFRGYRAGRDDGR